MSMTTEKMTKRKKEKENLKFSTAFCAGCFGPLDLSFEPPIILVLRISFSTHIQTSFRVYSCPVRK